MPRKTSELRALERAVEIAGGPTRLARAIGVSKGRMNNWLHRNFRAMPDACLAIERVTGVPAAELRPDVFNPDLRKAG